MNTDLVNDESNSDSFDAEAWKDISFDFTTPKDRDRKSKSTTLPKLSSLLGKRSAVKNKKLKSKNSKKKNPETTLKRDEPKSKARSRRAQDKIRKKLFHEKVTNAMDILRMQFPACKVKV